MRRAVSLLWWFLLVPYFWVKSWNSSPMFGESRYDANRINGVGVVALVLSVVASCALSYTRVRPMLGNLLFELAVFVLAFIVTSLLISREREQHYSPLYQAMPQRQRRMFGCAVFVLFLAALFGDARMISKWPRKVSCPAATEEMSADCA